MVDGGGVGDVTLLRIHIAQNVIFEDSADPEHDREFFWFMILDQNDAAVEQVMLVDPHWDPARGKLCVRSDLEIRSDRAQVIASVIAYLLQWRNWSETRWAGVGKAGRLMVGSMAVGVTEMVKILHNRASNNDRYYLSAARIGSHRKLPGISALQAWRR